MTPIFEPLAHTYTVDGQRYDSVTQVCSKVLGTENPWWKLEHQIRGTYVHRITEAIDDKDWDPRGIVFPTTIPLSEKVQEGIIQRGFAYQKFLEDTGFVCHEKEVIVWYDGWRLAGRIDKLGIVTKGRYAGRTAILDIKSGEPTAAAVPQLAFYQMLLRACRDIADGSIRIILWVRDDGTYRADFRDEPQDQLDAMSIMNVYRFMERNGLL